MRKEHEDFYEVIRIKIDEFLASDPGKNNPWGRFLILTPDLFDLIGKLTIDRDVPNHSKGKLFAAMGYFLSSVELMPEAVLGPIGYLDDVAIAAFVLIDLLQYVDPEVLRVHWASSGDIVAMVNEVLNHAPEMVGKERWSKLNQIFSEGFK